MHGCCVAVGASSLPRIVTSIHRLTTSAHPLSVLLQTANQNWKFLGGEYFNESISYGTKYADFMFKLSEKFKTAVSVKYQAPGEDLDPDSLISVQDDADLQVWQPGA